METLKIVVTSRLIAYDQYGRLLLAKRPSTAKSRPGDIDFVGGKVDAGESTIDALVREVKEEVGVDIEPDKLQPLFSMRERDGDLWFVRNYARYAKAIGVEEITQLPEHDMVLFAFPQTALELIDFVPHQQAIQSDANHQSTFLAVA